MGTTRELHVPLTDADHRVMGHLHLRLPAGEESRHPLPPLLDLRTNGDRPADLEPYQLLEDAEYIFQCELDRDYGPLSLLPQELFSLDETWQRGRLRPGLATGALTIRLLSGHQEIGQATVEVRSRKLNYLQHYRWMLREIAEEMAELIMERFAPTEQRFAHQDGKEAESAYQQFAFLRHLIAGDAFEVATEQILTCPHRAWVEDPEERRPELGIPPGSSSQRQLTRPGPRIPWQQGLLPSLPSRLEVRRTTPRLDTPENRFVKFALIHWRDFVSDVERLLEGEPSTAPVRRGLTEVRAVAARLDELLGHDLFTEVGRLQYFPIGSQVLQQRAGYRECLRAYGQFETAALLQWQGGEDVYRAGQRNVAALYEYWAFIQLARVVAEITGQGLDLADLIKVTPNGLGLDLKRGRARALLGTVEVLGRRLRLEFWYNRTFGTSTEITAHRAWSRPMRPDYSLLIQPEGDYMKDGVWLHFDAKYRVEQITELFGHAEPEAPTPPAAAGARPRREDLLKMHAYRDAIVESGGAYVLYPGSETEALKEHQEILPGLGAFPLSPTEGGDGTGSQAIAQFLRQAMEHVASQVTQHERSRWWVRKAHRGPRAPTAQLTAPFLTRPPADTPVLLGYIKTREHLAWIKREKRYNVRAEPRRRGGVDVDSEVLAVEFVLMYGAGVLQLWRVAGRAEIITRDEMLRTGYPSPGGRIYYGITLADQVDLAEWRSLITVERVAALREREHGENNFGKPTAVSWLDLLREE